MSGYDLLVCGGTVVLEGLGPTPCDVAVSSGRIAALLAPGSGASARETVDAAGLTVLPGIIDPHVHFGLGSPDDWTTESVAAARGGITTVLSYVQNRSSYLDVGPAEQARAEAESVIDFGLSFVLMNDQHLAEVERCVTQLGVPSFKYFTNFKGEEGAYLGIDGTDAGFFFALCREIARSPRAVVAVHTENIEVVWRLSAELQEQGRDGLPAWTDSRPDIVEADEMASTFLFASETGATVYIPHLSSRAGLEVFRAHLERGGRGYVETCPHYLTHTLDSEIGGLAKVNPPLRTTDDVEALWTGIADGTIAVVGSDHNSRKRERKLGSIWKASAGFPGVTTLLPVLLSEGHHKRGLPLTRIVEVASSSPARIFGMYPRKGTIAVGSDADFTIVDLDRVQVVESSGFGSHADYSIYDGWRLRGWPTMTIVRGTVVMRDGEILAPPGYGTFINRPIVSGSAVRPSVATVER